MRGYVIAVAVPILVGIGVLKLLADWVSANKARSQDTHDRWYAGGWRDR